ncbi:DNA ligase D [Paludibaculum fermentans]|uniref:DNA ligase D n=1 Tax=Paludibaculum fermentans TaxID=1473598 RepID=UPI003EB7034D
MNEVSGGTTSRRQRASAAKGESSELRGLMEEYPEVQLATLVDAAPEGRNWVHETKFDGYRLLGLLAGGTVRLRTRNGHDWSERFPAISEALGHLKAKTAVVDMEAVVLDQGGKSNFQALQAALGAGGQPDEITGFAFDLLYLDGQELASRPLMERKEKLRNLLRKSKPGGALRYSEHLESDGRQVYAKACDLGLEGIISKRVDAPYVAGRQQSWLKVKCTLRQEFIITGYSAARSGERALGALYLAYKQGSGLRYAGKVGTGFSLASAKELVRRFKPVLTSKPSISKAERDTAAAHEFAGIQWVRPTFLCEVEFTEWTKDGRIRHPSFQGLREDKAAMQVKKETPKPVTETAAAAKPQKGRLVVEGITITHPDRVISETGHVTKGEVAEYYAAVMPWLLPRIAGHPISLLRCPAGIDEGPCFIQRSAGKGLGPDVRRFEDKYQGERHEYIYVEEEKGLLELIQMGTIEIHPWSSAVQAIDYPDRLIFDLDPGEGVAFEAVKLAAKELRQRLKKKGLSAAVKCTGGKGLHVTVPLSGRNHWAEVKSFAGGMAGAMVDADPGAYIATMSKAKRKGRIFIDYLRNDRTATAIADYSVRARPGAPVAVPLDWSELKALESADQFTIRDVLKRLKRRKVPLPPKGQDLPA